MTTHPYVNDFLAVLHLDLPPSQPSVWIGGSASRFVERKLGRSVRRELASPPQVYYRLSVPLYGRLALSVEKLAAKRGPSHAEAVKAITTMKELRAFLGPAVTAEAVAAAYRDAAENRFTLPDSPCSLDELHDLDMVASDMIAVAFPSPNPYPLREQLPLVA